jgi:penicillin-binding protein 1B
MDSVDQQLRKGKKPGEKVRPQVALIALDPRTGEIKALVGGRNYGDSQLNHVVAMRQPGSVFKPFVYAAAIETAINGASQTFTPATLLSDEATTFTFKGQTYEPHDFHGGESLGDVTLRTALAQSLNIATVSLAQQVGYARVVALARRAGLNDAIAATPSVALGSYETTPLEIAAAYTAFANQGTWVKPTTIQVVRAADGSVLSQHQPETHKALDPRVAYITLNMMQEVLRSGTGAAVRSKGFYLPAAGKTGTSHDGWFAGFTTELLCVVWVGFDDNRELNLEGARSALPIWADFMKRAAQTKPYSAAQEFRVPAGVTSAEICDASGELAGPSCPKVHNEVFISGTEPTKVCDYHNAVNR